MPVPPPAEVLDLFAVPSAWTSLPGGQGSSVLAGDLVLSPGRDAAVQDWLSPFLARLAVRLDERPGRVRRALRIAVPVPARDGTWVVDGWAACRYEPGTVACADLDVVLAAGRLLHAELAVAVPTRPPGLDAREDRWARGERTAFGPVGALRESPSAAVRRAAAALAGASTHDVVADQLVHADLAGNVLLDAAGAPVVIDVAPAWRSPRWAEAVVVLDSVLSHGAPWAALDPWAAGADRTSMLRAVVFRLLSDDLPLESRYDAVLDRIGAPTADDR